MDRGGEGRAILDTLWGEGFSAGCDAARNPFNDALHDYIEEMNFGRIWPRPGLDPRRRCELTIAMLVAFPAAVECFRTAGEILTERCMPD